MRLARNIEPGLVRVFHGQTKSHGELSYRSKSLPLHPGCAARRYTKLAQKQCTCCHASINKSQCYGGYRVPAWGLAKNEIGASHASVEQKADITLPRPRK